MPKHITFNNGTAHGAFATAIECLEEMQCDDDQCSALLRELLVTISVMDQHAAYPLTYPIDE